MEFFDSVTPANIPAGAYACLYADGRYKATAAQATRFSATRWITVEGGAGAAAYAGIADYEAGNPVYENEGALRAWVAERAAKQLRARVYCNRATLPAVRQQLAELDYLVWIATLDGNKLKASYTTGLWAVQYQGGMTAPVDVSVLYGEW